MIKILGLVFIILMIFWITSIIKISIENNRAIYGLKTLAKKYREVESTKEDIYQWNKYFPLLEGMYLANRKSSHNESMYMMIKGIFEEYLLYYYPDDARLNYLREEKEKAKENTYKDLLLLNLNKIQFIINDSKYEKIDSAEILSLFNKVIYSCSHRYVTSKDDITLNELIDIVNQIKKNIHENTNEEIEWHKKINRLLNEKLYFS